MKYEDKIDMEQVDEKISRVVRISNTISKEKDDFVLDVLWQAYDTALEELIELIVTQWDENGKEAK